MTHIAGEPTVAETNHAAEVIGRSVDWLDSDEVRALAAWLAQAVKEYFWHRGLQPKPTAQKAALARRTKALERLEAAAVELVRAAADIGPEAFSGLPLPIREALALSTIDAGAEMSMAEFTRRAAELHGQAEQWAQLAAIVQREAAKHHGATGRQADPRRERLIAELVRRLRERANAMPARDAAMEILAAYQIPDLPTSWRAVRRIEAKFEG